MRLAPQHPGGVGIAGLVAGNVVSLLGTRLAMIALPWFVISSTGSASLAGATAVAQTAPYVVTKALGGPWVDRWGPRWVAVWGEAASGVVVMLIPLLDSLGALPLWAFLGLVLLTGATTGPADGAKAAAVPMVAARAGRPLERVTGLVGAGERLATTVGAAVAGAVIAWLGAAPALWVTAGCFLGAGALLLRTLPSHGGEGPSGRVEMRPDRAAPPSSPGERAPRGGAAPRGYLARLGEGAVRLRREPLLLRIYLMAAATNALDQALFAVVLPLWAFESGRGAGTVGLLAAVLGGAAVVSGGIAAALGHLFPRRVTYVLGFFLAGAPRYLVLAADLPLPWILGVFAVAGFASGFLNPIIGAVAYERIPAGLVGRVGALGSSVAWAGMPAGGALGGGLAAAASVPAALFLLGAAYLCVTCLPILDRGWAAMDRPSGDGSPRDPGHGADQ